jgi:hypothetical protein
VHWDRKLTGRLAQALMCIHAIKGVGIGLGPEAAFRPWIRVHDEIVPPAGESAAAGAANEQRRWTRRRRDEWTGRPRHRVHETNLYAA